MNENNQIRLEMMGLRNFRCFKNLEIDFHPEVTMVVARNGCGKTALLDALAVALGPFVGMFSGDRNGRFSRDDARMARNPQSAIMEMEPQWPIELNVLGCVNGQEKCHWQRHKSRPYSYMTDADAAVLLDYSVILLKQIQDHVPVLLPIVAYYGTGRLWGVRRLSRRKASRSTSRTGGYADCLNPSSNYREFETWFRKMHLIVMEEKESSEAKSQAEARLTAVREAVNTGLAPSGWGDLRYRHAAGGIVASHPEHGQLPVESLSDGQRNMIGMVGDIAYRMTRLNSQLGDRAAKETPGIIMIDELDMHLHPEWQQVVIESLRKAFPRVQFIVTTHSPQVLSTVNNENIRVLEEKDGEIKASRTLTNPYARESRIALEDIMSVRSRPPIGIASELEKYHHMIERGEIDTPEALQLRRTLDEAYGARSEELQLADLVIARWKALRHAQGRKA